MALILRKVRKEDLKNLMVWRMNPEVTRNLYTDPELTMDKQIDWYNKMILDSTKLYWVIEFDSIPIGLIWLYQIDMRNRKCEWGYFIGDDSFRGKGIARNLECNIYDFVFYNLNLNRLYCEIFNFNEKVIAIHQKFGSEIEGIFKDHIFKNGQYFDVTEMAILKSKWNTIKENYKYDKIFIEE